MRTIKEINIDESISKQKLVFKVGWLDIMDSVAVYFFFTVFTAAPLGMYFDPHRIKDSNSEIFYIILLPWVLFGIYVFYRKATEKHLIKINTIYSKQQNRQILLDFADKQGFEIYRKSYDCLIFNEPTGFGFNEDYKKSTIFIVEDGLVMFTILKDGFRLNLPMLTGHLFLKHDLKKLFIESIKTNKTETNASS